MVNKQEVLEILNKYAIEYLGGTVSIDENDFDDLASEISDLQLLILYIVVTRFNVITTYMVKVSCVKY